MLSRGNSLSSDLGKVQNVLLVISTLSFSKAENVMFHGS